MLQFIRRPRVALAAAVLGVLGLLGTMSAGAHHGFTGAYDAQRPIYMEGTVQRVTVAYPHVEMTLQVIGRAQVPGTLPKIADLGIADVMKLMKSAEPGNYALQVAGLQSELEGRIAAGDKIALVALRNCLPPNQHRTRWIRIASGEVVSLSGKAQTEVAGCPKS